MSESAPEVMASGAWWQTVALEPEQCWQYTVGPLTLYLQRQPDAWLFAWETEPGNHARSDSGAASALPEHLQPRRVVFRQSPLGVCLRPLLLERSVVMTTQQPVVIAPGEQAVFHISTPVCIRIVLQQPVRVLQELQTQRLSDTWFGPSTEFGELCYADRTQASHSTTVLAPAPHQAVTSLTIDNRSTRMLTLGRLCIPVPFLAVYGLPDGSLWTDPVVLEHDGSQALTRFQVDKRLPAGVGIEHRLGEPRREPERHGLIRAFAGMFNPY